ADRAACRHRRRLTGVRISAELRDAFDTRGAGRLAGAVVAAQGHAATAPPHAISAAALVARTERRRTDTRQNTLVAAAAAPVGGGFADPGPGRSAARPQPQIGGRRPAGAGGGQWLDRRPGLGGTPGTDLGPAAQRPGPPGG